MGKSNAEMDFDQYTKSPEGKRVRERSRKNLRHTIYFDVKGRDKLKKDMLKLQESALAIVENQKQPQQYSDLKDSSFGPSFLDLSTRFLEFIKEGEEFTKSKVLSDCSFRLMMHKSNKSVVFASHYKQVSTSKWKRAYILIASGLPSKGKRRRFKLIRNKFNLSDYKGIDKGTFEQKIVEEYVFRMKYFGKNADYRCKMSCFKSQTDKGYVEIMK